MSPKFFVVPLVLALLLVPFLPAMAGGTNPTGKAAVLPPLTHGRSAALKPVTIGRPAALKPVTHGRAAALKPVTDGRPAAMKMNGKL